MSRIDAIRARALEIAESHNKTMVGTATLIAAILREEEVESFFQTRVVQITDIQSLMLNQIEQSASQRDGSHEKPIFSDAAEQALEESLGYIRLHQSKLRDKDGLVILAVMLNQEQPSAAAKILINNGITGQAIAAYLASYGIDLWNREAAYVVHDSNDYYQIFEHGDQSALAKYTSCLNDEAHFGKIPKVVGRDEEIRQVMRTLRQRNKSNPLLVGEAGVGKTAIVEALAQMAYDGWCW